MKQSTTFAQVATNLLNLLQGYTKGIRFVAVLTMLLTVGIGQAWGAEGDEAYTLSCVQNKSNSGYANYYDVTINSKQWNAPGNQTLGAYWRIGGKGVTKVDRTITGKNAIDKPIQKITVNHNGKSNNSLTVHSFTITVATDASFSKIVETKQYTPSISTNTKGSFDLTPNASIWASGCYYKFTINVSNSNNSSNYGFDLTSIVFYEGVETVSCNNEVKVTKGTPSNGSFSISKTGTYETCGEALVITLSNITPDPGYQFGEITQSGINTDVTIDQENKKVTYAQNTSGTSTINVTFTELPKYTVSFSTGSGNPTQESIKETVGGAGITLPTGPTPACNGWEFAGWATSSVASETTTAPTTLLDEGSNYKPTSNCTLYAVYKRTEETEGTPTTTTKTYTHTITAKTWTANGVQALSNVSWTLNNEGSSYFGYDGTKGQQVGSGSDPATSISLTTSGFASATKITAVKISTSGASSVNAKVGVKVGSTSYTCNSSTNPVAITTTNTQYTFTGSSTGNITISWTQTSSKALYFKTIEVEYQTTSGSGTTSTIYYHSNPKCATTYSVTSTLSHVTASGENPSSVTDADDELMLEYSAESGWNLPANITVTMGGAPLSSETDYDWDNGDLFIAPASGFTGDIVVSINGWQQLAPPSGLNVSNITSSSATLSWGAVANASSYTVELLGENKDPIKTFSNLNATTITISDLESSTNYILGVVAVGDGSTYLDSEQTLSDVFTTSSATCTVTYDANGGTGTAPSDNTYTNGATVTVVGNYGILTKDGYAFTGWNTAANGTGTPYKNGDTFTITGNTTLYAQWCEAYWKLVTDASELEDDTRIIIAAKDYNVALSKMQNNAKTNRVQVEIIKQYNTIYFGNEVQTLTLVEVLDDYFALYTGLDGFLYAASSNANELKTGINNNGNGNWDIVCNEEVSYIAAKGTSTHNQLKYNSSSSLFSCYAEGNSQKDVVIYKEVCKQDSYNVTSTLTNATAANGNPTTVSATATSLTLNYTANTGYLLPETITVKMGGATLVSGTDYNWNKETGVLAITVTGFYGDIDVKIVAEEDPCYQFAMSEVTANSTTNSITLSWSDVNGATGYNVKIGTGEFTAANGLTHTFEGLEPNTSYNWEVQAVKDGANFHCEASKTGTTTTLKESFTVSWVVNGDTENPVLTESVVDGENIKEYPSSDPSVPSGCSTKVFVGWTNQPIPTETNETPTLYTELKDIPAITANTPLYAVWADKNVVEGKPVEEEVTASVNISTYATANSWSNDTKYESVIVDSKITASASSNGTNTGKYFTNGNNWRFYQSDNGQLTITATEGCTIKTVKITYSVDKTGVLTYGGSNTVSGSEITVNASSATFGVGNTASATNGQVRITAISVTYTTTTEGPDEITYSAYTTLCDECTPSEELVLVANALTADLDINGKATITFTATGGNGGAITYAANPNSGVSWENGVATFTQKGNYQITASQEKNGDSCPTVSNTLNVTITAIPYLYFTTEPADPIVFDPVECGGHTRLEDKKSVSVQAYNLEAAVTVTVTGDYKIARTSSATLNEYTTSLTLRNNITDGKINGDDDVIYILSFPPAGSSESTEGTLTFKTTNGNTLPVNLSTPTITCTPCTLTFNDRDIKTTQEYYAGTEVPEPTTPTGVCGEYEFDGWALAKVESGSTTYEKVKFPYNMPANNQTVLHAVYRYTEGPTNEYELVTEIESGKNYVIAAYDQSNGDFALTNQESNTDGKFNSELVECDANNIITTDNSNIIWTVTGNDEDGYEFYNSAVQKYIEMYRYDGKSLLRLVDNCVNPFYVNIEKDLNNDVTVDITSQVDVTYKVFSFYERLFNVYKSCDYNIYFYEQTATPLYTTTPDCHPSVTLTSDGEVYVTATNGRGIMAATPLTLTTIDLAPNTEIAISSNSDDIYFSTERNTNFAMAAVSQPQKSLTLTTNEGGELEKPLYIHYKPSADGNGTPAEVVVTADVSTHNPPFTAQKTIHVRNLPAKFVIATKAGATWYALPANMSGATNPAAVVIEVDETTMTATAPNTIPYTLFPVKTTNGSGDRYTQYGDRVRFSAINYEYRGLWANNNATEQTIRNFAVIDAIGDDGEAAYEWKVTTTVVNGQWQYTLYSNQTNNQNHLCYSMNQENPAWGTYASNEAKYQLYFLPIKAETTPFDYQVVEWYPNKVLIQTSTVLSSLTAKIAGEQVADVQYNAKDANQYEITGLPLMENPAKALTLEFELDAVTHSGTHTIPVMLSGGEHSISDLSEITKGVYNYTNLVVRDGATLTIDGTTKADNTFYDVTIYPTAKIVVPDGKKLSLHSLTFIGGISEVYNGSSYELNKYAVPELSLKGTLGKTVTTIDYLMRVDLSQMYSLALPYDVALSDITYGDGSAIGLGTHLYVSAYDGAARAQNLGANKNWVYETDFATKFGSATLKAGVGYTISAQPQAQGDKYAILRLPMKSNIASGKTEDAKSVAVTAHGADKEIADNHKGWNLVANPYMASISGDSEEYSELMLRYMEMLPGGTWQWTGDNQRYVTIPYNDGSGYYQLKFSEAVLQPFKNFFVQVGETGTLDFVLTSRQNAPARYMENNAEREVEFEIMLGNELHQDNAGMLISEKYTPAYEINADLEKMTGSMSLYTIYNGYKLAYNATSPNEAEEWIPVGYIVPKVGEYTFKLDERTAVEDIIHIYLMDNETGIITDLIDNTYTFETSDKKNENRFVISVVLSQKESGTTTGVDNLLQQDKQAQKFIYNDQLFILRDGVVYDAMGQRITTINK